MLPNSGRAERRFGSAYGPHPAKRNIGLGTAQRPQGEFGGIDLASHSCRSGEYTVGADEIPALADGLARQAYCFVVVTANKLRIGCDPIVDRREGIARTQA
jgi:hypothetical protein